MKHMRFVLTASAIMLLIAGLALTSCNKADAGYDDMASQISSATATPTDSSIPSYVMPEEVSEAEANMFMANIDANATDEHDLGGFTVKTAGGTVSIHTADGMKAASFKLEGGKMVPAGGQPMDNQVKSTYSGPEGDNYTAFHVYPASHKAGDGMKPFFAVDHDGGQVTITPGKDITITSRKSRGKTRKGSGSGGCGSGATGGGGG